MLAGLTARGKPGVPGICRATSQQDLPVGVRLPSDDELAGSWLMMVEQP